MMEVKLIHEGGGVWRAANAHHARLCDQHFECDEILTMAEVLDRSMKSHRAYFATIREAWKNLPENLQLESYAGHYQDLRKHALIMTGYRADPMPFVMTSHAEALRAAPVLKSSVKEYALASVRDNTVTIFTAKSQSLKSMGRAEFQESKDCVLTWCSELIGVDVMALRQMGHNGGSELESAA